MAAYEAVLGDSRRITRSVSSFESPGWLSYNARLYSRDTADDKISNESSDSGNNRALSRQQQNSQSATISATQGGSKLVQDFISDHTHTFTPPPSSHMVVPR